MTMLKSVKEFSLEKIIDIVIRRRWFIIIPFCISMLVGIYLGFKLPRVYSSETLILVEPQKVPTNYVKPIVSNTADRISTISQQIMSRSNLEKIIDEFKLYSNPGQENIFIEDKIEFLRNRINIKLTRRGGSEVFSISFTGRSPEVVMKVTNTLSTRFINQNLKIREAQGVNTSNFLEKQMTVKRKELENIEESLKKYRKKYMGELPEQLETNLRALDRIQKQIDDRKQAIRDVRKQLVALSEQQKINNKKEKENFFSVDNTNEIANSANDNPDNIIQLKAELAQLKLRYTDSHPDVINIKNLISQVEERKVTKNDKQEKSPERVQNSYIIFNEEEIHGLSDDEDILSNVDQYDIKNTQKEELKSEIDQLKLEIDKLNREMRMYQRRVENTPKREQELISLRRDYNNISESYNSLLKRKIEAEIAVSMEKSQEGERFRILDYAQLPEKPISPNMPVLFFLITTMGLGIGGGISYIIEYFNKSFRSYEDIEAILGISVAITIPVIYHEDDLFKKKVHTVLSAIFIAISIILFISFAILTIYGVEQTKELINRLI
jgi:polysaccharide chain length determinant protein (PEP-CTERM system associated)